MGYAIHRATGGVGHLHRWKGLLVCLVAANAPDLDFLPGLLVNDANRYHHGLTHTLAFSVVVGLVVARVCSGSSRHQLLRAFAVGFGLCASHILLDYLTVDPQLRRGVPALWPLSHLYFISSHPVFPNIERSASPVWFFPSLFSLHNLRAVCVEALVLLPIVAAVSLLRRTWKVGSAGLSRPGS